jgi:hypothetical protein
MLVRLALTALGARSPSSSPPASPVELRRWPWAFNHHGSGCGTRTSTVRGDAVFSPPLVCFFCFFLFSLSSLIFFSSVTLLRASGDDSDYDPTSIVSKRHDRRQVCHFEFRCACVTYTVRGFWILNHTGIDSYTGYWHLGRSWKMSTHKNPTRNVQFSPVHHQYSPLNLSEKKITNPTCDTYISLVTLRYHFWYVISTCKVQECTSALLVTRMALKK